MLVQGILQANQNDTISYEDLRRSSYGIHLWSVIHSLLFKCSRLRVRKIFKHIEKQKTKGIMF